jgi:hypothetical protein
LFEFISKRQPVIIHPHKHFAIRVDGDRGAEDNGEATDELAHGDSLLGLGWN